MCAKGRPFSRNGAAAALNAGPIGELSPDPSRQGRVEPQSEK